MSPQEIILRIPGLLIAISVHEYAHAKMAWRLGDDSAAREGRLTIEPWAHLDPIGAIMMVVYGFGWAKPVPVNPFRFRNPKKGMAAVAFAGPAANLVTAAILQAVTMLLYARFRFTGAAAYLPVILQTAAFLNAAFAFFNLIPVPPLDGSKIVGAVIPRSLENAWGAFEKYGFIVLMVLIFTHFTSTLLGPLVMGFMRAVQNAVGRLLVLLF